MLREIKPKTARAARLLKRREPQAEENPKTALFLKSTSTSALNNAILTDLHSLKRPLAVRFTKKNSIHPFEDASSLEFFSQKNDASLLCFGSHSKKRPHNLTFVRTFDAKLLDMLECLVDPNTARLMSQFGGIKSQVGTKPMLSFTGPYFEDESTTTAKFRLAKSMFLDFFRGGTASQLDVEGLQTFISFAGSQIEIPDTPSRQIVHMRVWRVITRRSGQKLPRVELEETGPRIDFRLGRSQEAEEPLLRESLKRSRGQEAKLRKNVTIGEMGDKVGRLHILKQDLGNLQARKMKGLKRHRDDESHGEDDRRSDHSSGKATDDTNDDEISFIDEDTDGNSVSSDQDMNAVEESAEALISKKRKTR